MTDIKNCIRVGIAGAGAVACGTAAILETNGHMTTLWSPSGKHTLKNSPLSVQGIINVLSKYGG